MQCIGAQYYWFTSISSNRDRSCALIMQYYILLKFQSVTTNKKSSGIDSVVAYLCLIYMYQWMSRFELPYPDLLFDFYFDNITVNK